MNYDGGLFSRIDNAEEIRLHDFQETSVGEARCNFREKDVFAQILSLPTGAGKTTIGAHLLKCCYEKGNRGMFVVDRISLLGQTSRTFDRYGIPHGVIQSGHPRFEPDQLIQVASIHTLARRGWATSYDLIVSDEQHVLYKTMKDKIARKDAKILGLTATPFTSGLGKFFQRIVNVTTTNKLIAQGILCPYKVWAASEPDMKGVATDKFGEWEEKETSKRATRIVGDVVQEYLDNGGGGKAIAFGVDVVHCEEMQRQFLRAGIKAELYTYLTSDEEREWLIGDSGEFRKPDSTVRILISVAALSRGFDVPDVSVILMCRPLRKSFMEFCQVIGRGLRASPGKDFVRILDLAGNFMRHYPAMVEFFEEGAQTLDDGKPKPKVVSIPAEKKPRKCPRCKFVFGAGSYCPACGYIFPPKISIQHEQGKLMQFDGRGALEADLKIKTQLFSELVYVARTRNYSKGWVRWMFKKIAGVPASQRIYRVRQNGAGLPPSGATLAVVDRFTIDKRRGVSSAILAQRQGHGILELDLFA